MSEKSEGEKGEKKTPTLEELQKKITELTSTNEGLSSTNNRLLEQSQDWKSQLRAIEAKVDKKENSELHGKKDFQGLYEKTMTKLDEVNAQLLDSKKDGLKSTLKYEVSKHAKDAHSVDDVIYNLSKNPNSFAYNKEKQNWEGVEDAINDLRKNRVDMFDQEKIKMAGGRPQNVPANEKSLDDLIVEDPNAVLESMLAKIL